MAEDFTPKMLMAQYPPTCTVEFMGVVCPVTKYSSHWNQALLTGSSKGGVSVQLKQYTK